MNRKGHEESKRHLGNMNPRVTSMYLYVNIFIRNMCFHVNSPYLVEYFFIFPIGHPNICICWLQWLYVFFNHGNNNLPTIYPIARKPDIPVTCDLAGAGTSLSPPEWDCKLFEHMSKILQQVISFFLLKVRYTKISLSGR